MNMAQDAALPPIGAGSTEREVQLGDFACPCCSNLTLNEPPPGTFAICDVCGWEDDDAQFADPTYAGGANAISLNDARANYRSFGAKDQSPRGQTRPPPNDEGPVSA
jgi:hypothetical protein